MAQLKDLIVTGSSRFLNDINGNITGSAAKLGSSNVGSATQPIYLSAGTATACTYTLGKSVPSDAVFTDHYAWADITGKPDSYTPSSHTHGNIQNGGTLQTNDITIANGDKLVVTDSSDSAKVARTSISFDGSTATKCLTQKGTWESFATTDTKNTAGSTDTSSKIYLIGAASQAASAQTYSDSDVYIESGALSVPTIGATDIYARQIVVSDNFPAYSHAILYKDDDITMASDTWDGTNISLTSAISELHKNKITGYTDISSYASATNMYTFPSDGYVFAYNAANTSSYVNIYGSSSTQASIAIGAVNAREAVFVRKGMRCYITGSFSAVRFNALS